MKYKGISPHVYTFFGFPHIQDFKDLLPGCFWGEVFNITSGPYSYYIEKPDEYKVQAIFVNKTKSWLKENLICHSDFYPPYTFRLPEDRWWEGEIRSNIIQFKVVR
ncbi:MAG: hypothetical protein AB2L14_13220 [Candidatus Xenobiia bacterium LiM19]